MLLVFRYDLHYDIIDLESQHLFRKKTSSFNHALYLITFEITNGAIFFA